MSDDRATDDVAAVEQLLLGYADCVDTGDFEGLARLLADADLTTGGTDQVVHGYDGIRALYERTTRRYEDGTPKTKHLTTNIVVAVDGDVASAKSYFTVLQAVPGTLPLQPIVAGRYRDRFERVDGGWRFTERHILVDLVGDISQHLLFDFRPR